MLKNEENQFVELVAINAAGKVSGQADNITATLAIDNGEREDLTDENPVEIGTTGHYRFSLTKAETNGHALSVIATCSTPGIQCLITPGGGVIYTDDSLKSGDTLTFTDADGSTDEEHQVTVNRA